MSGNSISYIIYFSFLYLCAFPKHFKKNEELIKYLVIFSLIIFIGLRGYVATDYSVYAIKYREAATLLDDNFIGYFLSPASSFEKGFTLFMCFCRTFSDNYFFFQLINFLIDLYLFNIFINYFLDKKLHIIAYIALFCFQGFIIELNLLRNSKAIMMFCVSLIYLDKRKYLNYCLLNFLGSLFHISAIFYFVLPFFIFKKVSKKIILFLFIIGNIFFVLRIKWIFPIAKFVLPIFGQSRISQLISTYVLLTENATKYSLGFGFIERNLTYLLMLYYQDKILKKEPGKIIFINMVYINNFIYLLCSEFLILTQRLPPLVASGYWIMIPSIYCYFVKKERKYIYWIILLFYLLIKISAWTTSNYMKYTNAIFTEQNLELSSSLMEKELLKEIE
ncbi:EpsG family protein [uncultured Treponema sp.]|uniref:EpsG family protein n=1 Tax=uncultured Treponema sp. TaxID=162155 RepID=UPI00280A75DB|nr:EpsG family protein [uncultured Treponema sp.]